MLYLSQPVKVSLMANILLTIYERRKIYMTLKETQMPIREKTYAVVFCIAVGGLVMLVLLL